MTLWQTILAWLASLTVDASTMSIEAPKSSASVIAAYASMATSQESPDKRPQ